MTPSDAEDLPDGSNDGQDPLRGEPRLELVFRSELLAAPFEGIVDEGTTIQVDAVVALQDGTHLQYWTVEAAETRQFLEVLTEYSTVEDARLLSTVGDTNRFEVRGSTRSLFSAFEAGGGVTRSATYDGETVSVVAEFPPDVDETEVTVAVRELFADVELVSTQPVVTESDLRTLVEDALTDRQLTVLQVAYYGGYFEQPRTSTGAELAAKLGISKQAFHEHLRKAYAQVFGRVFATERPT